MPFSQYLAEVKRMILEDLSAHQVRVYLFGSRARGAGGRASDVDVAILPLGHLPPWVLSLLREKLEESRVPYSVEVVDLSQADAVFRERVLREGVLWSAPENG